MPAAVLSQVTKRGGPRPVPARRAKAHAGTATAAAAIVSVNVGWEAATRPRRSVSADRTRVYECRILSFIGGLLEETNAWLRAASCTSAPKNQSKWGVSRKQSGAKQTSAPERPKLELNRT